MQLNPAQQSAVTYISGPCLVLAGAGSGKTAVITHKIRYLVNQCHFAPDSIAAVTFTNKAAAEMKQRIADVIGDEVKNIWAGTFHGIANRILKRHPEIVGLKQDFTIIDSDDQLRLIKQIAGEFEIDMQIIEDFYATAIHLLLVAVYSIYRIWLTNTPVKILKGWSIFFFII